MRERLHTLGRDMRPAGVIRDRLVQQIRSGPVPLSSLDTNKGQ
ncbi:hypothetical protein M3J09_009489 [Ascochyta lentis]